MGGEGGTPVRVYTRKDLLRLKPPGLYKGFLEDISINPPVEDLPTATAATNGAAVHSSPTTEAADQGKNSQKSHIANDQATKPEAAQAETAPTSTDPQGQPSPQKPVQRPGILIRPGNSTGGARDAVPQRWERGSPQRRPSGQQLHQGGGPPPRSAPTSLQQRGPPPHQQTPPQGGAGPAAPNRKKLIFSIAYIESIPVKYKAECSFVPQSFPPRFARILKAGVQRRRAQPRQGGRGGGKGKKVITLNRSTKSSLHKIENAWGAARSAKAAGKLAVDPDEAIQKAANGIFNKITKKSFAKLTDQLLQIGINSTKRMTLVLDALFERALDFHEQCPLYAQVCGRLQTLEVKGDDGKPLNFRELLIAKCVDTFDIVTSEDGVKTQLAGGQGATLSEDQKKAKAKRLLLGFMVFMGEIYITGIINLNIVTNCIEAILGLCPKGEEYLECACKLMQTVGQTLDKQKIKSREGWFLRLQQMEDLDGVSKRMVFTIENLIDLRLNKWAKATPPGQPRKRMEDRTKTQDASKGAKLGGDESEPSTPVSSQTFLPLEPEVDAAAEAAEAAAEAERERRREEERLESTIRAAIEEFREQRLVEELLQDVDKFAEKGVLRRFWSIIFDKFLDCKEADVEGYEDLIAKLAENGKIASEDYSGSLTECLEFLPDLALDAPSASNRFGVAVGAGLAHHLCTHDVFESDFFEELDLRSSQVVFIEVLATLAKYPQTNPNVAETCGTQIETVQEIVLDRFKGEENRSRIALGLLRKGILDRGYFLPLSDSDRVQKYLELATKIVAERGAREKDVETFLELLGEQLSSLFGEDETLKSQVIGKLIEAKPSLEAAIASALADDASTGAITDEDLQAAIDKYTAAEDLESEFEALIQEIADQGGDSAMVRFCELVCDTMAREPGKNGIEGVLKLATAVAASEDVAAEHWHGALVASLGNLGQIAASAKNSGTRFGWAIALGVTNEHCTLALFEEEAFGHLLPDLRVEVFTATLIDVGSRAGTEGIEGAQQINGKMLYGSDQAQIQRVADKLGDFKQLKSFLPLPPPSK